MTAFFYAGFETLSAVSETGLIGYSGLVLIGKEGSFYE